MVLQKFTADLTASIPSLDIEFGVVECQVTLDDGHTPYVEARLTVALPDEETLDLIDPRDDLRLLLEAESSWSEPTKPDQTRSFDLRLHEREIDHDSGTVLIRAVSDESLLIDGGLVDDQFDTSAELYQSSLRDIVDLVLGNFGASLESGTSDADFTITSNASNLMRYNPTGALSGTAQGYTTNGSASGSISVQTTTITGVSHQGKVVRGAPGAIGGGVWFTGNTTAGATSNTIANLPSVIAGDTYTVTLYVRTNVAKNMTLNVRPLTEAGAAVGSTLVTAFSTPASSAWTRVTYLFTAPATATRFDFWVYLASGTWGSDWVEVGAIMVLEGDWTANPTDYFDGAKPDDSHYDYGWTGTANASTSTRTRLDNRSPDLLKMEPGATYWQFLSPLIRTAGLRLWCDEQRQWWLTEPGEPVAGTVTVSQGTNAIAGTDLVSLQATTETGAPVYFTGIVVKYRWTVDGEQLTEYDFAGTGDKVYRIEVERPYPGPGYAQALLDRASGRGRTQDLTALMDLNATPGMALVSTLPGTPIQVGTVSAVTWRWSADSDTSGTMLVASRGLTDTPPTAWVLQPEGYAWEDVPTGVDWTEYTTP